MSLWYPEAQAAKKLGYLFLKTPWWFQFSLAYPHSTMNLHLSTKRKPIESSGEFFQLEAIFSFRELVSVPVFVKKNLYYTFVPMEKGESTSFNKPHSGAIFGKFRSLKSFNLTVLSLFSILIILRSPKHCSFTEDWRRNREIFRPDYNQVVFGPPKHPQPNSRNWKPRNPHLPTSRLQRTHILRKNVMKGRDVNMGNKKHPASSGGDLVKVMKSYVFLLNIVVKLTIDMMHLHFWYAYGWQI